jgi:cytoskeletal protein CcmA (bactofilin family)
MAFWGKKDEENKKNQAAFSFSTGGNSGVTSPSPVPNIGKEAPQPIGTALNRPSTGFSSTSSAPLATPIVNHEDTKIRSALGPGTVIHGKLSFDAPVSIDGKLSGEIFSSKALHVGKSGSIDAAVEVASLVIRGTVKGVIKASERVEIKDGGQLIGEVVTPVLVMDEGCTFNGSCTMPQGAQKKIVEVRKEASGA